MLSATERGQVSWLANHLPAMFIYCDVSRPLLANKITREFAVHAWTCSRLPQPHTRY